MKANPETQTIEKGKIGIVVTVRNHTNDFSIPCLDSLLRHTPHLNYIVVFDNESTERDAINLPSRYSDTTIEFVKIHNQTNNGGLTGTWNQGIDKCFDKGCGKIILLNQDTVVNESWTVFIDKIEDDLSVYGPISEKPGWNPGNHQKGTLEDAEQNKDLIVESEGVNGFCLGFTQNALLINKFNEKYYFDPKYPFRYNEREWQNRFKEKGGKFLVIKGCFVFHHKDNAWVYLNESKPQKILRKIKSLLRTISSKIKEL